MEWNYLVLAITTLFLAIINFVSLIYVVHPIVVDEDRTKWWYVGNSLAIVLSLIYTGYYIGKFLNKL